MTNLRIFISELIFKVRYWLAPEEKKLELAFARAKKHADALGFGYLFNGVDPKELAAAIYYVHKILYELRDDSDA